MDHKKEKEGMRERRQAKSAPKPLVTLVPPAQEGEEEWLRELEREAAGLIQRRLQ